MTAAATRPPSSPNRIPVPPSRRPPLTVRQWTTPDRRRQTPNTIADRTCGTDPKSPDGDLVTSHPRRIRRVRWLAQFSHAETAAGNRHVSRAN